MNRYTRSEPNTEMVNLKRVLTLTLASVCLMGTSFIHADYKSPITLAPGVSVTNLIVNKIGDRPQSYRSVVKIVDGCRVIYMGDTYVNKYNQLEQDNNVAPMVVSDVACNKGLK